MLGDRKYFFEVKTYQFGIWVILSKDFEKTCKTNNLDVDDPNSRAAFVWYEEESRRSIYILLHPENTIDVVCHEAVHVANRILYDREVFVSFKEDESVAYLTQYIFREIIQFLMKTDFRFIIE